MTPRIVVDLYRVRENAERFLETAASAFPTHELSVFYAYKALPSPRIVQALEGLPIGVEVMSVTDLRTLRQLSANLPLVVSGYVKSSSLILSAIAEAHYLVLENRLELSELEQVARDTSRPVSVLCRVKASPTARLGLTIDEILACCKSRFLTVLGVHFHAGWNETDDELVAKGVQTMATAAAVVRQHRAGPIIYNFGGSFCERSFDPGQLQRRFDLYGTAVESERSEIHFEPGRYMVGDAGRLSTTVRYLDVPNQIICLDTCAYGHRLTGASPNFVMADARPDDEEKVWEIHGFWSAESDRVARAVIKGRPFPNAILHIENIGAYTLGIESQFRADQPLVVEFVERAAQPYDRLEQE